MYDWVNPSKRMKVKNYFTSKQESPFRSFLIPKYFYKIHEQVFFSLIYNTVTDLTQFGMQESPFVEMMN